VAAKECVQAVDSLGGAILEQSAVAGEREGNAVMSGPFRHLANVAPSGNQNGHKAVPQTVKCDAVQASPSHSRTPDVPRKGGSEQWTTLARREHECVWARADVNR
jgi:hypothetical protein